MKYDNSFEWYRIKTKINLKTCSKSFILQTLLKYKLPIFEGVSRAVFLSEYLPSNELPITVNIVVDADVLHSLRRKK